MSFAIPTLKKLYRETVLTPETAGIAFPDTPEYRRLAEDLNVRLKGHMGGNLPLLPLNPAEAAPSRFPHLSWPSDLQNPVLLGNAIDNPFILKLYLHHFTLTDRYFPGPDGFFLETVHNPWGDGRNAVLAGGSDPEGVRRAADTLVSFIERHGPALPPVRAGISRRIVSVPGSSGDRDHLRKWRLHQLEIGDLPWPTHDYAYLYYLTQDPYWGELFRDLLKAEISRSLADGRWPRTLFDNYFNQYRMLLAWNMIEESDLFSDEDRLWITNLLYEVGKWVQALDYFREAPYRGSNHQTYACLSLWESHVYFSRYYGLQDFAVQLPVIARIFELHRQTFRSPDDEPSTYLRMPRHLVCYDLENGHEAYFRDGHLARLCEEIIRFVDNRGDMCSFGDCGEYDTVHTLGPWDLGTQIRALSLLGTAAWYYGRKDFAWAQRFARKNLNWRDRLYPPMIYCRDFSQLQRYGCHGWEFQIPAFHTHLPEEPPAHLLGVTACPLDPKGVEMVTTNRYSPSPLPQNPVEHPEELFTALTFRRSFDRQEEYLCLHGVATLNHSHHHANCILRLTWRDRIVLAEGDEMKFLRRYQNGLVIIREGEHHLPPGLARLKFRASFPYSGFSRTLLENDNGLDWERNIIWCPGHFFMVLDHGTARREGDYLVEARWMTLGDVGTRHAVPQNRTLLIHQNGERFALISADDSAISLTSHLARYVPDREAFQGYEHAPDGYLRLICQTLRRKLKAGESLTFINLICPVDEAPPLFQRIGKTIARMGEKHPCLTGRADEGWSYDSIAITAQLFTLSEDGFSGIGMSSVAIASKPVFSADPPVAAEIDVRHGRAMIECQTPSTLSFRAQKMEWQTQIFQPDQQGMIHIPLPVGRHELHLEGMVGPEARQLRDLPVLSAVPSGNPAGTGHFVPPHRDSHLPLSPFWQARLDSPARAVSAHRSLLAVGGEKGNMLLLDSRGQLKGRVPTGDAITRLLLAPRAASGMTGLLAGTKDTTLALYTLEGDCLWRKTFGRGYRQRPRQAYALAHIAPPLSQTPHFLVGFADETLMALSLEGEEMWQVRSPHHAVTLLAPFESKDGVKIVAGSEHFHLNLLDAKGQTLWQSWRGPACVAKAGDLDGDGRKEIAWGDWYGLLVHQEDSEKALWDINLGGETVGLAFHPAAPMLWAVSDIGQLIALTSDGILWRVDAHALITCMIYLDSPQPLLALGTQQGDVQLRRPSDGALLGAAPAGGPVMALCPGPHMFWSIAENGAIWGWI